MRWLKKIFLGSIIILFLFCLSLGAILFYAYKQGPPPIMTTNETILYDQYEQPLFQNDQTTAALHLENISPYFTESLILTEDKDFYKHVGFDIKRIVKAIINNLQSGKL